MKQKIVMTMTLMLGLAMMTGLTGCTYVQRGAAIGASAGAITGGVIGNQGPEGALRGALWGAGAGGTLGALIGDGMSKGDPGDEIANLKNQIASLTDENNKLREENNKLREENERLKAMARPVNNTEKNTVDFMIEGDILFASGSDVLTPMGVKVLSDLATKIHNEYPGKALNIQGHTDNMAIRQSRWKSNWELGSARALSVLHFLVDKQNFVADNMSATTFSMYKPLAANDSPESRHKNRRAVIVVKVRE